jgi:hypothetical protein
MLLIWSNTLKYHVMVLSSRSIINTFAKTDRKREWLLWYRWVDQNPTTESAQKPWILFYHCSSASPLKFG